jgi:tetrachlorobenzoquinone reductase
MMQDGSFVVHLARTGGSVRVGRAETILAALGRIGIHVRAACNAGVCGTCETSVLAGIPHHRDQIFGHMSTLWTRSLMVCCSRSATPELTLDL